jgi:hypothetical protein
MMMYCGISNKDILIIADAFYYFSIFKESFTNFQTLFSIKDVKRYILENMREELIIFHNELNKEDQIEIINLHNQYRELL